MTILEHVHEQHEGHAICRLVVTPDTACLHVGLTACRAEQARLQEEIWLNHGCGCLLPYGDDGEMQCCGLDFTRTPIPELVRQLNVKAQQRASNRNVQLGAQVTTLTAALRRYGQHMFNCDYGRNMCSECGTSRTLGHHEDSYNGDTSWHPFKPVPCDCGFAAVLRAASEGA